ncbi:MAG: radical SAM protein [Oscillospiraceae bacterium]|nr:radical SAM protein [Oscillospiraceae bacterium]
MSREGKRLEEMHPCFSVGRKNRKGRIHLPVSPACNLACRFCSRVRNDWEQRPGVSSRTITPQEAVDLVGRALDLSDTLTVAGIAGPGDALATPHALETFRLIRQAFPQLILCLSTNGLLLPDMADELAEIGVETLTVTVNDVDPARLARLNAGIVLDGKSYQGEEAAEILIPRQLAGIRRAADLGVIVKANTVLVPRINGPHIADIAKTLAQAGAGLYNIIPLIPSAELSGEPLPTCAQIDAARVAAAPFITVFRHCQHCRADAVGVPGETDLRAQLYPLGEPAAETFSHG